MRPLSTHWRARWARMVLWSASAIALGCGPPRERVQAHPVAGGVDPSRVDHASFEPNRKPEPKAAEKENEDRYRDVEVILYREPDCKLCEAAEQLLRSKGVKLTVEDVETVVGARAMARIKLERTGSGSVNVLPVVDIEGHIVRGYQRRAILETLDRVTAKPY